MKEPKLIPNPHFPDDDAADHFALYGWDRTEGRILPLEEAMEAAQSE